VYQESNLKTIPRNGEKVSSKWLQKDAKIAQYAASSYNTGQKRVYALQTSNVIAS
jgi:hypothetical protein